MDVSFLPLDVSVMIAPKPLSRLRTPEARNILRSLPELLSPRAAHTGPPPPSAVPRQHRAGPPPPSLSRGTHGCHQTTASWN